MRQRINIEYSVSFKQMIVREIELGRLTKNQARRLYCIGGGSTISNWIKQLRKDNLLSKTIRIQTPDEVGKLKELENKLKEYEKVIANLTVKAHCLQTELDVTKRFIADKEKKRLSK